MERLRGYQRRSRIEVRLAQKNPCQSASLRHVRTRSGGSWFDHPFWRSKFLLTDPADLQTLRSSGVKALWIDVEKGVDVETATPAAADAPPLVQPPEPSSLPSDATASTQQCSVDDELQRASRLLKRSKEQVTSMFNEARLGKAVDPQQCQPLVEQISASLARNGSALLSLARLKTKDEYTYMHSVAVCALMVALARQLDLPRIRCTKPGWPGCCTTSARWPCRWMCSTSRAS